VSEQDTTEQAPKAKSERAPKAKSSPSKKEGSAKGAPGRDYVPRLKTRYRDELVSRIMTDRGYGNPMQVPRLEKIVVNMGVGDAVRDARMLDSAVEDLQIITGQKVLVTKARKSIAGFKLREGMSIGAKVTLRGNRMWEFLDRLLSIAIPRIRDFRGLTPNAFDGRGNYTIGLTEQLIFPEIDYDKVVKVRGMDITIVTTAMTDEEGRALLLALGFPLQGAPAVSAAAAS
jgi:large subunit ribosomal protein L5